MQLLKSTLQLVVVEDGWTPDWAGPPTRAGWVRGSGPTTRGERRGYRDTIVQGGRQRSRGESASETALKIHDLQQEGRHVGAAREPEPEPEENQERRTERRTREQTQREEPRREPER